MNGAVGILVESGAEYSDPASPSRKIAISTGTVWGMDFDSVTIQAFDSNVAGTFTNYYRNGANWTSETAQTNWENTKWDNNSGPLATMSAGFYSNRWVYITFAGRVGVLYGQAEYANSSDAELESSPSTVPVEWGFDEHAVSVVRITC